MTAEELLNKLKNNKDYQDMFNKKNFERQKQHDALVQEAKSFSNDCLSVGYELETPWDLISVKEPYPKLIPILIKHFEQKNYSPKFREGVARALAVKDSSDFFDIILSLYNNTSDKAGNVKWAIACALSGAATTQKHFDIIEQLILDAENGNSRNALLDTIKHMKKEQKERILKYALTDSQLLPNLKTLGIK